MRSPECINARSDAFNLWDCFQAALFMSYIIKTNLIMQAAGISTAPLLAMLLIIFPAQLMSCRTAGGNRDAAGAPVKEPAVIILNDGESQIRVKVEVVRTPEERATGLMYRDKLDKGTGMLFIFEEPEIQSFWMKNTLIPLDMIFVDSSLEIVGIVENAQPLTLDPRRIEEKSHYVLEVNGGFSSNYGISKGMKVNFIGFEYQEE